MNKKIKVGVAQIAPVWLQKSATIDKVINEIKKAKAEDVDLLCFGETLIPGYPFWLALMNGSQWDAKEIKCLHAAYMDNAICIEDGDLEPVLAAAKKHHIALYLGVVERPRQRGGHSLYASFLFINDQGEVKSVHRKLQPTYDERLTWSPGDGNGLVTHDYKGFTLSGLNCWENWMPLPRATMYAQGTNLHVACWPGSDHNTKDITRFIAREGRTYVVSASNLMRRSDFPQETPLYDQLIKEAPEMLTNGGSCIAGPDGEWIVPPQIGKEQLITATLHLEQVYQERQNFDPSGHYSRPDVTSLTVNFERQSVLKKK